MDLQSFRKPGEKTYTQRSRLFVGNLPTGVTKQEVEKLFSKYGKPSEFSICFINKDRGFGFIRLETRTLAKIAKAELDDTPFRGRQLRVRFATHGAALTVKNLPQFMSNELLEEAFSIFSQIERAILIVDDRRRPTGKGIVEDTGKPAARKALDRCSNGAFLLTAEREQPPRFAQPGTFEYEYDVRWKALMKLGNQQNEQVEGNIVEAQEKLGPEMEAARHEHQVMLMRQDLLRRQEGLRRMEELYNQELQKRKQMELHEEQERRRREEELRMHTEEMLHRQQEGFKGSFPENREQEMRMHTVDQAMGLNRNPMAGNPVSAPPENMPAEASPLMEAPQAVWKLMEESESEDSSAPEDCDTDEELYHFEDRLDPAVDDLSDSPSPKRRRMSPASWNSKEHADVSPPALMFKPTRPPGVQLRSADRHTPLDLFKIFFSKGAVKTLCRNTNRRAAMHVAAGKKYKWTDVSVKEFYRYIGLVFYMAMVKLDHVRDYWRQNTIFSQILPSKVMSRDRYMAISWNVHMSDPDEDPANDQKRGTPQHDRLFRLKPLMTTIQDACKAFYQPRRSLAVDERMVATKAKTGMTQYMKAKPTKWGFKLFVLADSSNGYTLDFSVYTGKNDFRSGQGLSYDIVMSLLNRHYLGCGYHVYMDNFYTSPKLLTDLFSQSVGACGTYRDHTRGCPRPTSNAMSKKSARGTIRWIRDGPTVFVKWMDTREVSVCSTIHSAYKGDEVRRRVKSKDGTWTTKIFPCPSPVVEYNSHMGGVDLSDQLIQYYSVQHKSMKWYRKLFLHFLDIAATNAYILHKELLALVQQKPMSHKDFMEELIVQLCGSAKKCSRQSHSEHVPVPVNPVNADAGKVASYGRRTCMLCRAEGKRQNTPWKCQACDVPLCLQLTRNCFEKWHKKQ